MLGIVLIAWPESTIVVLVVLWGVWALIDGIGLGAQAFAPGAGTGQRVLFGVMALIAVVVAFLAFTRPGMTAARSPGCSASGCIVRGAFELVGAFTATTSTPRWLLAPRRGASTSCSVASSSPTPGTSAVAIAVVLGIAAVAWGVVFVVARPPGPQRGQGGRRRTGRHLERRLSRGEQRALAGRGIRHDLGATTALT